MKPQTKKADLLGINSQRIIKVKVDDLKPNPIALKIYNYRTKKDIKVLAETMKDEGQKEPISIYADNTIISGHRRYKAALMIELKELDAIIKPIPIKYRTSDEIEQYKTLSIVIHNQQRKKNPGEIIKEAEAILGILGIKQGKRTDLLGEDVNGWGQIGQDRYEKAAKIIGVSSGSTLRRMMDVVEFEKESDKHKEIGLVEQIINGGLQPMKAWRMMKEYKNEQEDLKKISHTKIKPSILKDNFSLYNKSSDKMSEVKSGTVQVVFTSPPYYDLRNYDNSRKGKVELGLEKSVKDYLDNLSLHLKDVKRVLSETGSFFLGSSMDRGQKFPVI